MALGESEPKIQKNISRRSFLRGIASTAGLVAGVTAVGASRYLPEISYAQNWLSQIYGLENFSVRPFFPPAHAVPVPEDAGKTLLVGEFSQWRIELPIPPGPRVQRPISLSIDGIERYSKQTSESDAYDISQFAIVAATDSMPPRADELLPFLDVKGNVKELLTTWGIVTASIIAANSAGWKLKEWSHVSRRRLLAWSAGAVGSMISSNIARGGIVGLIADELQTNTMPLDVNSMTDFDKDLAEIFNPLGDFWIPARNRIMFLNTVALAGVDFSSTLDRGQISFASGHRRMLDKFYGSLEDVEQEIVDQIREVTEKHMRLVKKYLNDSEKDGKMAAIALSLASFFGLFDPVTIRINTGKVSANLNSVRQPQREQQGNSVHLLLMHTLKQLEDEIESGIYSQSDEVKQLTRFVVGHATRVNQDRLARLNMDQTELGFIYGLAGDKRRIDERIDVFKTKTGFSNGLTAEIIPSS